MRMSARATLALALVVTTAIGCSGQESAEANEANATDMAAVACDRDCLIKTADDYLAAIAAKDPSKAALAENVVFVENVKRLKPGEGLWRSATGGKTDFAIVVPDEIQQQVGWLGVVESEGKPMMLAVRLKLQDGKITEAEHLMTAPAQGTSERIQTPRPGLLAIIPEGQRADHAELIRIGASYYDALDDNDGSKTPFAADCVRHENGIITAGEGAAPPPNVHVDLRRKPTARDCAGQLDSKTFVYIDKIENRRVFAADPVTGLVMGLSHFRHPMTNLPYEVTHVDGSKSERNKTNMPYAPFDMPAAHIFKIGADKQMHEIEAVGVMAPLNSATGWE